MDDLSTAPSRKVQSAMRRAFRKQRIANTSSSVRCTDGESRLLIYTAPRNKKSDQYVYVQNGVIKMDSAYPSPKENVFCRLLARLIYRNGAYSVVQEQYGPIIENYHMVLGGLE